MNKGNRRDKKGGIRDDHGDLFRNPLPRAPVPCNKKKTNLAGIDGIAVLGIDPGLTGAFVLMGEDVGKVYTYPMPVFVADRDKSIYFDGVLKILSDVEDGLGHAPHVFLERAMPLAMGSKHAFNYGRGFETLVIAISLSGFPFTMVEPSKWTKEMHEGTRADLKPKARSLIAAARLYPKIITQLPKKRTGGLYDGFVDALLIAGYGLRRLTGSGAYYQEDFY